MGGTESRPEDDKDEEFGGDTANSPSFAGSDVSNISITSLSSFGERLTESTMNVLRHIRTGGPIDLVIGPFHDCPICCCEFSETSGFKIEACEHRFCKRCLNHWFSDRVNEGQYIMYCPFDTPDGLCGTRLLRERLPEFLSEETIQKLHRFEIMSNELMRECPYCQYAQLGDPETPEIKCAKCQKEYCFSHSNAHVGMTCKQYDKKHQKEFKKSMQAAGEGAKLCPGCGAIVTKSYGCNHMTCRCGKEFCYICGIDITKNVDSHFLWGCNQYDGDPNDAIHQNIWQAISGPDFLPMQVRAFRILVASYFYLVFGPIVLAFMMVVLPFYIPVMVYFYRRAPHMPLSIYFVRWVRAAEVMIAGICALCAGCVFCSLCLVFVIPIAIFVFLCDGIRLREKTINSTGILSLMICYMIAFLMSCAIMSPLVLLISCMGCWSFFFCPDCFDELQPERDLVQVPVIAFAGPNAV